MEVLKLPAFLQDEYISMRDLPNGGGVQYKTEGMSGVLAKVAKYKPKDAYAMLVVTNIDLYEKNHRPFCYSATRPDQQTSIFSQCRFDPAIDEAQEPALTRVPNFRMRVCHNIVRELSYLFGLAPCIYYECVMNSLSSPAEQRRDGIKPLCPVCIKKLKLNLQFDCT